MMIALVGYTNVGKSALMNAVLKKDVVESKDLLFQTLRTTSRQYFIFLMIIFFLDSSYLRDRKQCSSTQSAL